MTTAWLLLLLVVVSSQSVDGQPTTDDAEIYGGAGLLANLHNDMERMLDIQQQFFQTVTNRLGKFIFQKTVS